MKSDKAIVAQGAVVGSKRYFWDKQQDAVDDINKNLKV